MVQTGINAYKQNAVNSVISKEKLLMKLYDGSLNFLALAKRGMKADNPRIKGENITKVLNIVTELDCALDMDVGGEMAENLSNLYRHIMFTLIDANLKNDIPAVENVEHIIREIKAGFEEVLNLPTQEAPTPPVEAGIEQKGGMPLAI